MNHLTRHDYASALQVLARIEAQAEDVASFARAAVLGLNGYVASELTTLSVCDLFTGHRQVVGLPGVRLGADEIACFDRHFFEHPLVLHHGMDGGEQTRRLSDLVSRHDFQRSALYGDYYQRIGLEYAIAVPLQRNPRTLVSVVLNRRGLDFNERDRERLELLRPHLAFLYSHACHGAAVVSHDSASPPTWLNELNPPALTLREGEVMHWLACGKTDTEIAALLSISPRTVQKHLEHMYVKLGVETRTAAVMRALDISERSVLREPLRRSNDDIALSPAATSAARSWISRQPG
ncbi:helix-turn-helix transcriptional regulator [Polaromonas sp. SM01]|uniref:helix-turn-helix transcriptional regulator n=1 Tax=Polaromonas sp. SM01 TaxID=3085630 RepID=UPI002982A726|nr:helix-turn-helix transcriptional regulator [Polaromonas sp. SM01]MDW5442305.1 helix-turn-helix transcriptional regulator [Polaromonas sp. SM01]